MDLQNLAYALTQVVHNAGAVAVVGGAICARTRTADALRAPRQGAWLVLVGWGLQAASGAGFGIISYAYYSQFPDIHGVALAALYLKMACAAAGGVLAVVMLRRGRQGGAAYQTGLWSAQVLLGIAALTAAAFLRWFS